MTSARTEFPGVSGAAMQPPERDNVSCQAPPPGCPWILKTFKVPVQNVLHVIPSRKCFTAGGLWDFAYTSGYSFTEMSQPQISAFPLGSEQPLPALVFPQWTKALVCRKEGKGGRLQGFACIYLFLNFLLGLSLFLSLALQWIFLLSPGWFGVVSRGPLYDKKNQTKNSSHLTSPHLSCFSNSGGFVSTL